jgi:hypothetical protein
MEKVKSISEIEDHLYRKLKAVSDSVVFTDVYAGTLPSTLTKGVDNFVLIDCENAIYGNGAYSKGTIGIYLYALPSGKVKNVDTLYLMEQAYDKFLDNNDGDDEEEYHFAELYRKSGYDSSYGMHYVFSAINLIV